MRYAMPLNSRERVNIAGKRLLEWNEDPFVDLGNAMDVIDNWRASHAYPAQSIFVTLKRRACKVHKGALVAQRIKRLPSIVSKLQRETEMRLSQMQDIGGCRAVVQSMGQLRKLQAEIEGLRWSHERLAPKNYIAHPKMSGYRGIHLKYKYVGTGQKAAFNGLKIEIQLRTLLQHKWATAVEAADTFTHQSLKASRGNPEWERFFALMGSIFALQEKSPLVPNTPTTYAEIAAEIKGLNDKHHIAPMFTGYAAILPSVEKRQDATYFLVTLNPIDMSAQIKGFKKDESQLANREYTFAEKNLPSGSPNQIVLVSVSSIAALRRVYPNYFLDTAAFAEEVWNVIKSVPSVLQEQQL